MLTDTGLVTPDAQSTPISTDTTLSLCYVPSWTLPSRHELKPSDVVM